MSNNGKKNIVIEAIESFQAGLTGFVQGLDRSTRSPTIRAAYKRFFLHFAVITVVGYVILSATMLTILPILFLVLLGPIVGLIAFFTVSVSACFIGLVLWLLGRFPSWIFVGSFGILRPFFSVPQMAFLLTSLLIPMSCITFAFLGMDACYDSSPATKSRLEQIKKEYKKPNLVRSLKIAAFDFLFGMCIKLIVMMAFFGKTSHPFMVDSIVTGFYTGTQLVSISTLKIRNMTIREHLDWCFNHALQIIGFVLPLQVAEYHFGWASTILWLGIGYAATAPLVKDLMLVAPSPAQ